MSDLTLDALRSIERMALTVVALRLSLRVLTLPLVSLRPSLVTLRKEILTLSALRSTERMVLTVVALRSSLVT
jgi:hypothetical protein